MNDMLSDKICKRCNHRFKFGENLLRHIIDKHLESLLFNMICRDNNLFMYVMNEYIETIEEKK